ncbi:DUF433 domain-containing protein [Actinophytocola oryzae]|uniref:Uncharacterized protein (DUF433 family) n=1 Tax=Actinophytocola oryzae TaxID=502181 RepID=A0A4R7V982_9PSEU|nr:DUF433 domain-containing protein [Actinophytocola oryzae]TDV45469.1 uncharacterized protein (DUF433 family) [Actinophytocola oryzae]
MGDVVWLMDRPVYTYPQVDRMLTLTKGTAMRWLNGYRRDGVSYAPILRTEPSRTRWVTWGEFVETRLLAGCRDVDRIPVPQLRHVVEVLREKFDRRYPLANAQPYLKPAGRLMLWSAQDEAGLSGMFGEEVTGQLLLAPWVEQFVNAAQFDDDNEGDVATLRPDPDFPAVRLDPYLRGGEPVMDGRSVRVTTIAGLVRAGERPADVAEWYELTEDEVRQAVSYDRLHARRGDRVTRTSEGVYPAQG